MDHGAASSNRPGSCTLAHTALHILGWASCLLLYVCLCIVYNCLLEKRWQSQEIRGWIQMMKLFPSRKDAPRQMIHLPSKIRQFKGSYFSGIAGAWQKDDT